MYKIYFTKRRKVFQYSETTTESQLNQLLQIIIFNGQSTNYDVSKIIEETEENEGISIPKGNRFQNWNDIFSDFLSESKQTQLKRNTETPIDSAYLYEVPLQFDSALSISPSIRKFVIRKIKLKNLINQFHQLSRREKDQKINVTYHRLAVIDEGNHEIAFLYLLDEKNKVKLKNYRHQTYFIYQRSNRRKD
ncbi:unnamed protein product [Paramecium primaurelia]|uniref:Uncharacterized protein n=1 Tax=Paramecium primaurelia TaxID=5886 RepID=A0A8S1KF14_PARPR|nr:unnamed protein product [Paramecium primaurelia]